MRNVIIVEERFEARGTQRGLALPTAAFADATVRVRFTGPSCRMADANSGSPASPAYTGVSSRLIRNETRRSVDAGSPERVAVGIDSSAANAFSRGGQESRHLLMNSRRGQ